MFGLSRIVSKQVSARSYSTLRVPTRNNVVRTPTQTRGTDHTAGSGTAAFNEREKALENKNVKDHEASTIGKLRDDLKKKAEPVATPAKKPRNAGLAHKDDIQSLQSQIDALQSQLNKLKK